MSAVLARRFRDLYQDIAADLGGLDLLSEGRKQLIRRAAMLSAESERLEALAARGEPGFDIDLYGQMCDRLGRVFARIGLSACRVTPQPSNNTLPSLPRRLPLAGKDKGAGLEFGKLLDDLDGSRREWHPMLAVRLHAARRDGPNFAIKIKFRPLGAKHFPGAGAVRIRNSSASALIVSRLRSFATKAPTIF